MFPLEKRMNHRQKYTDQSLIYLFLSLILQAQHSLHAVFVLRSRRGRVL